MNIDKAIELLIAKRDGKKLQRFFMNKGGMWSNSDEMPFFMNGLDWRIAPEIEEFTVKQIVDDIENFVGMTVVSKNTGYKFTINDATVSGGIVAEKDGLLCVINKDHVGGFVFDGDENAGK